MKTLLFLMVLLFLFGCDACSKSPTGPTVDPTKEPTMAITATKTPTPSPTNTATITPTPNPFEKHIGIIPTPDGRIHGD